MEAAMKLLYGFLAVVCVPWTLLAQTPPPTPTDVKPASITC